MNIDNEVVVMYSTNEKYAPYMGVSIYSLIQNVSKDYVYNLVDSINEEFAPYFNGNDTITVTPVTTPKLVFRGRFSSEHELSEALKATCPYLSKAYSIKSNGATVVAFRTEKERTKDHSG